ncbi:MAG: flavodoxin family protein [Paludibacteraceae bacterium]|nr:flavodoxin family protein [Paludibacteraceae bacterium]
MNIIILSGSPRNGGNTEQLVDAFVSGASNQHSVEVISINDYHINPCIGCNSCFKRDDNSCFQNDNMKTIYSKLKSADMLVIASPVYFYGISAQLKAIIDRCHNPIRNTFNIKQTALILVGAATLPELFDSIITQYELCLKFFNLKDSGRVLVSGCRDKKDVEKTDALRQAYELGRSIE